VLPPALERASTGPLSGPAKIRRKPAASGDLAV